MLEKRLKNSIYALIMMGGNSTRFGKPKGTIQIDGVSQWNRMYSLLAPLCEKVFFSLNDRTRSFYPDIEESKIIKDFTPTSCPMVGLLSALKMYPARTWLLVAVDLVFLNQDTLITLIESLDNDHAVFTVEHEKIQPLCALYAPSTLPVIQHNFSQEQYSLYKMILTLPHTRVRAKKNIPHPLTNVNSLEELHTYTSNMSRIIQ